jgi:3-dehydroquinate synthetase
MSAYKLPHGYSVAIGTAIAARYSAMRGLLDISKSEEIVGAFGEIGALDSIEHSQHVIGHPFRVAEGVDIWRIANPGPIEWFADIGKTVLEDDVDLELVAKAVHSFAVSRRADIPETMKAHDAEEAQ